MSNIVVLTSLVPNKEECYCSEEEFMRDYTNAMENVQNEYFLSAHHNCVNLGYVF